MYMGTNNPLNVIIKVFGRVYLHILAADQGRVATHSLVALDVNIAGLGSLTGVIQKLYNFKTEIFM